MEIIKLEFQGIGPFTDHHVIDFREIGQGGLFLLEGPTGSGKTTILDAIVFALYGDVAGADSSKARIVSTLLKRDGEPFVDLVIDSSRGLLRIRRTPEFERPKLRGEGTTTSRATMKLWKLASPDDLEGAPVSTNIAEASEELQQAIGLTKSQFTQTVMLPQGHFATFLRAKPEDRRDVLQDIFGTEFYERFAKKLADLALEHRKKEELARQSVFDVANNYCQVAWYDDASTAAEPIAEQVAFDKARDTMDLDALLDGARQRSEVLAAQLAQSRAAADAARTKHQAAAETLRSLETRNRLITELTALGRRRRELQEREAEVELDEGLLAAAERADHVRRPITNTGHAAMALQVARRARQDAFTHALLGADADLIDGDPTTDELRSHEESARLAAGLLDRLVALEKGLAGRSAAAARERQALHQEDSRIATGRGQVAVSRAEAVTLAERLVARDEVAATLASAIEDLAGVTRRHDAAGQVERLTSQLAEARAVELKVSKEHQDAELRHSEARNAWLGALAGELAGELLDGAPCVVCGSEVHPAPAIKPDGFVGRDQVQALADARDEAARKAEESRYRSDKTVDQLAGQALLTEGLSLAEAEAGHVAATKRQEGAKQATRDVVVLRQQIAAISEQADAAERVLRDAEAALAARSGGLDEAERQLAADQAEVTSQADGFATMSARQQALTVRADTAKRLAALLNAEGAAEVERDRCTAELATVLAERGFVTVEEARAAMLADPERTRLQAAVTAYHKEVATVDAHLADERYAGLGGAEPEDPVPARLAEQESDAAQREAHRSSGIIEGTANAATQASKDLTRNIAALAKLSAEAGPVLRMANLTNAGEGNLQQVTLPTYVLLRRFEEVVDLANVRLDAMTGGRYELRRTDEKEGRSRKLGLGLEVVDHTARDTARDPKTLSGGETFMASLALALGLADAVTSEVGGIELHTLFVDEGFGSLDAETLDAVMDQLSALRDGGRSVGVVSHVAEMKQRIAERVTVVPRHDGTSTLLCSTDSQPLAG
ncbi:MAG: SMC family ATPase [Propionicimonas sp.]